MKLIIQIPCYNEEKTLPQTIRDLPKRLPGVDEIEYLVVDDGSTDATVRVARMLGVNYVVKLRRNKGLAAGFMAGLDACLAMGADIIVNTDADNQYCGADIGKLIAPIVEGRSDIVIGSRPIDETEEFSRRKKSLQHFGSWVVRRLSKTDIPDSPSGFRAFSREAAMRMNVMNRYTYTLETIIQAGRSQMAITSVPIRTNPATRKSRLFKSMGSYIQRAASTLIRAFIMYNPLMCFLGTGAVILTAGVALNIRYFVLFLTGGGRGHIQSLILASVFVMVGMLTIVVGVLSDLISSNRRILEDVQYHVRRLDYAAQMAEQPAEHMMDARDGTGRR